jgi:hypothetical protein
MTDTVPMPPKATEFILSLHRAESRDWRRMRLLFPVAVLGQLAFWWIVVPYPPPPWLLAKFASLSATELLWVRIVLSAIFPWTPVLFTWWLASTWKPAKLAKDARSGRLHVISGQYTRGLWCGTDHPEGEQYMKVEGVRVAIPLYIWLDLPKEGTIEAEYFPHSRLAWRINGVQVSWKDLL